jgi:hypothetical protein
VKRDPKPEDNLGAEILESLDKRPEEWHIQSNTEDRLWHKSGISVACTTDGRSIEILPSKYTFGQSDRDGIAIKYAFWGLLTAKKKQMAYDQFKNGTNPSSFVISTDQQLGGSHVQSGRV